MGTYLENEIEGGIGFVCFQSVVEKFIGAVPKRSE
jgi:hypothetical protein